MTYFGDLTRLEHDPRLPFEPKTRARPHSCRWVCECSEQLKGKFIVVVLSGNTARMGSYKMLQKKGVHIIMVAPKVNWAEPVVWRYILTDVTNIEQMVCDVKSQLKKWNITPDAGLTYDEYGTYPCAVLTRELGVVQCPASPEIVKMTNVKGDFRDFCEKNGIRSPKFTRVESVDEVATKLSEGNFNLEFPVVCKPSPGAGSMLAKRLDNLPDLKEHCKTAFKALAASPDVLYWNNYGKPACLQVEEYISGQEIDVDVAVQNGVIMYAGISDNKEVSEPYFCEMGGMAPTRLPEDARNDIYSQLEKYVTAAGTDLNCILHYECKYDAVRGKSYVIEVNLRIGAAETDCLNRNTWGTSLALQYARLSVGLPVEKNYPPKPMQHMSSVNFRPSASGSLVHQHIPASVLTDPSFVGAALYHEVGSKVMMPPLSFSALGWLAARGDSPSDADENLERLSNLVEFKIEEN
eukprot:TRINITY_DN30738_c0_g1_i1.p1 TRINITY_DN30738_c0_g1~~TRINITY_DN30738_c0_g1_i1.p1  ORF type:complete len:465 (+),score=58.36 TRINITY_DN30738_c0_g1_i1:62-1456(+)